MLLRKNIKLFHCLSFLLISIVCFLSTSSYAFWYDQKIWRPVFSLGIGAVRPTNSGFSKTFPIVNPETDERYEYDSGNSKHTAALFDGFIGMETMPCPEWAWQLGIGYNQSSDFSTQGRFSQGADPQSTNFYSYRADFLTRQLLAEAKFLYAINQWHPYVFAGIGVSFNKASNYNTDVPPFLTFTRIYKNNTETSFSYALGAGVDMDFCTNWRWGVGYRFADLGRLKLGHAVIDTTKVNGTLSRSNLYANELLTQLTYLI